MNQSNILNVKRATFVPLGILFFFTFFGCDKFKGDTGPAGPQLSGNLYGYVALYDEYGRKLINNSGVSIKIESTSQTATSDGNGYWLLTDLKTGTYAITFSKAGYGTYKRLGFLFTGGGDAYYGRSQWLMAIPTFTVSGLSVSTLTTSVTISGSISSAALSGYARYVRFFIGTVSSVSSDPKAFVFSNISSSTSTTVLSTTISASTFNRAGISSGTAVYLVAYPTANSTYFDEGLNYLDAGYSDPTTGKTIYPNIGTTASNVLNFIVP